MFSDDDFMPSLDFMKLVGLTSNPGRTPVDFARSQEFRHRKPSPNRKYKHK